MSAHTPGPWRLAALQRERLREQRRITDAELAHQERDLAPVPARPGWVEILAGCAILGAVFWLLVAA